jgi:hypothetical protein
VVGVCIVLQLILGGVTVLITVMKVVNEGVLVWLVPSAHVAVGALLLAAMLLLTIGTYRRLYERDRRSDVAGLAGVPAS